MISTWILVLTPCVVAPSQAIGQARRAELRPITVARQDWDANFSPTTEGIRVNHRSAARILAIHTVVGTGAGLLIGLALSGASVGDDRTAVVLTWTAVGAAAGLLSGIASWLLGRDQ